MRRPATVQGSERHERDMDLRRATLRARGVPERFVEAIATRDDNAATFGGGLIVIVPLLGAIGLYWLGFEAYLARRIAVVVAHAQAAGAWLWAPAGWVDWVGALCLLLATIGAIGWIYSRFSMRVPPYPSPCMAASILRTPAGDHATAAFSDWITRRSLLRAADEAPSADALLEGVGRAQRRLWSAFTLIVGVPALAAVLLGADGYWLAGPKGALRHELGATKAFAWPEAREVVLGCNESKDSHSGERHHDLRYEVVFPGWTQDFGNDGDSVGGTTMTEAARLQALARVDAVLRAQRTPRRRWRWLDKDPMDPMCLGHWRAVAGPAAPGLADRLLSTEP